MKRKIYRAIVKATQWLQTLDSDMVMLTFVEVATYMALLSVLIAVGNI